MYVLLNLIFKWNLQTIYIFIWTFLFVLIDKLQAF